MICKLRGWYAYQAGTVRPNRPPGSYSLTRLYLIADPLDDIKNTATIAEVMKNSRLYDTATLNETYPRQKALAPQ